MNRPTWKISTKKCGIKFKCPELPDKSPELPRKPPKLPENLLKFTKIWIDERLEDEIQICVNCSFLGMTWSVFNIHLQLESTIWIGRVQTLTMSTSNKLNLNWTRIWTRNNETSSSSNPNLEICKCRCSPTTPQDTYTHKHAQPSRSSGFHK